MENSEKIPAEGGGGRSDAEKGNALQRVTAYALAAKVGDLVWEDAAAMKREPLLAEVAAQLVRAAGGIAASIAEGYARRSARDRIRYYEYALGSTNESESWYRTGRRLLLPDAYDDRVDCLTSIRRLLLVMIRNEQNGGGWNSGRR
jgi:four helix bundle protein